MSIAGHLVLHGPDKLEGRKGFHYNYIMAADGLFISAQNQLLEASVCIAPASVRGLTSMSESVQLAHGKIPASLLSEALILMQRSLSREVYVAVVWGDGRYSLRIPEQEASGAHVTYQRIPNTVLDLHSHPTMSGTFSGVDNRDEVGFQLYGVIGRLDHLIPEYSFRVGVYGYFHPMLLENIFGG